MNQNSGSPSLADSVCPPWRCVTSGTPTKVGNTEAVRFGDQLPPQGVFPGAGGDDAFHQGFGAPLPIVERLFATAPAAIGRSIPHGTRTPAATGIATRL